MPRRGAQSGGGNRKPWWQMAELLLPALLVGAAAVGWLIVFSPRQPSSDAMTTLTRVAMTRAVPTQAPTLWGTALPPTDEPVSRGTALATFTGTPPGVTTPTAGLDADTSGLEVGGSAVVVDTGSSGLNMRTEASVSSQHLRTLPEGAVVQVLDGPLRDDRYVWWKVRDEGDNAGWVVGRYLQAQ